MVLVLGWMWAVVLQVVMVSGTTYYIDNQGNDNNVGTSPAQPWKSIAYANTHLGDGDTILFKRGQDHRGWIGNSKAGVKYADYGTATTNPTIKGSRLVSNTWTVYSGSIYVTDINITSTPFAVWVNGSSMTPARFPNSGYNIFTCNVGCTNSLGSDSLLPSQVSFNITGSTIHYKNSRFHFQFSKVSSWNPASGAMGLASAASYTIEAGYGYYLDGLLAFLDAPGEWYYGNGKLYIRFPSGVTPQTAFVEVGVETYGFYISTPNVTVSNLTITHGQYGFRVEGNNAIIRNCILKEIEIFGVYLHNMRGILMTNNQLSWINGLGVYTTSSAHNVTISYNSLANIGVREGRGFNGINGATGIYGGGGTYYKVLHNVIYNIGYIGVRVDGTYHEVAYNHLYSFCITLDDCGGLYAWGTISKFIEFHHNIIHDALGTSLATPGCPPTCTSLTEGIYLDDYSSFANIHENIIWSISNSGIKIHNHQNATIWKNVLFNCSGAQIGLYEDALSGGSYSIYNSTIYENIMFALSPTQKNLIYSSTLRPDPPFGIQRNNQYINPYSIAVFQVTGTSGTKLFTINDLNSSPNSWSSGGNRYWKMPWHDHDYQILSRGTNLITNPTFDSGISSWGSYLATLSLDTTNKLGHGNSLKVSYPGTASLANTNSFVLQAGKNYQLTANAVWTTVSGTLALRANMAVSPYGGLGWSKGVFVDTQPTAIEIIFTIPSTFNFSRIDFQDSLSSLHVLNLDDVSIYPVTVQYINPNTRIALYANPSDSALYVTLPSRIVYHPYNDPNVNITCNVVVQPWSYLVLVTGTNTTDSCVPTTPRPSPKSAPFSNSGAEAAPSDNVVIQNEIPPELSTAPQVGFGLVHILWLSLTLMISLY